MEKRVFYEKQLDENTKLQVGEDQMNVTDISGEYRGICVWGT
jgi:hypothetical protein